MSQTTSPVTNTPTSTANSSLNTSDPVFANAPILELLKIPSSGLSEAQLREETKKLRLLRTSAPALKKALNEEDAPDEETVVKTVKKTKKKKDDAAALDSLLKNYGV